MKRTAVVILLSMVMTRALGQSEYTVNDISDLFYARITTDEEGSGTVSIINKKDNNNLLKVGGEQLNFGSKPGRKIMLYKDQIIIKYDDFNFDGQKDLAIQEFYSTKGPAYVVYLFHENSFKKDDEFTRIIQESQGGYKLDPASNIIYITSSGGCCSHASATFIVKAGRPIQLNEESEEINPPFTTLITREWKEGKKTEVVHKTLNLEDEPFMSFELVGNKKRALLFVIGDQTLSYALVKENDEVEFNFPASVLDSNSDKGESNFPVTVVSNNPDFTLSPFGNELFFKNTTAEYKIYQKVNAAGKIEAVGILVKTGGKEYDLKGDMKTLVGNLKDIPDMDNLVK